MSNRFIKFIPGKHVDFLLQEFPHAFLLLCLIAQRARRTANEPDGLQIGDAFLGDYESAGLSRKQYRNALEKLENLKLIKIVHNGKKFQNGEKRAIKKAIKSTLVNLSDSSIWDINAEVEGQQEGQRGANEGPTRGHKQEGIRMNKKEEDLTTTPKPPKVDEPKATFENGGGGQEKELFGQICLRNPKGEIISISESEVYRHFLKSKYSTKIIEEAIKEVRNTKTPVGNILRYIEAVCERIYLWRHQPSKISSSIFEEERRMPPKSNAPAVSGSLYFSKLFSK